VSIIYFTNQTVNGDSALSQGVHTDGLRKNPHAIYVTGNFGTGTIITAYATADGVNWLPVPDTAPLTAPGIMFVSVTANALKLTLSGASGATNITAIGA
jgi:hypothetical protein